MKVGGFWAVVVGTATNTSRGKPRFGCSDAKIDVECCGKIIREGERGEEEKEGRKETRGEGIQFISSSKVVILQCKTLLYREFKLVLK